MLELGGVQQSERYSVLARESLSLADASSIKQMRENESVYIIRESHDERARTPRVNKKPAIHTTRNS